MERTHDRQEGEERALVRLFRTDAADQTLRLQDIAVPDSDGDLLWVDLCAGGEALLRSAARRLALPQPMLDRLLDDAGGPQVSNHGDAFLVRIECLSRSPPGTPCTTLDIAAGPGFAATVHDAPIGFLDELRDREQGETRIGVLTAESFVASLLDWYLADYVDAATTCERAVDDLEEAIMHELKDRQLPELDRLRRDASRLRRMLNRHRRVFAAIGRPDFRPGHDERPNVHFASVRRNYEHVAETLEDLRAMVAGTFHLFGTRIGMRTNRIVQALTVATVVLGFLAVVAATMGMNFEVPWFDTGAVGFGVTLAAMAAFAFAALGLARWKRWI